MASVSIKGSLVKRFLRQLVADLVEQGLLLRGSSTQLKETDLLLYEQDVTPHQPSGPMGVYRKGMSQDRHLPDRIGTADEDDPSLRMGLQVELPVFRKGFPAGCRLPSREGAAAIRRHIFARLGLQRGQRQMRKPGPDLGLPASVVALNRGLESGLPGRHKHRHHRQAQTQPHYASDDIGIVVGPLEHRVLVKLGIPGQPPTPPMCKSAFCTPRAVTEAVWGQEATRPPCSDTAFNTSTSGPSLILSPSTISI